MWRQLTDIGATPLHCLIATFSLCKYKLFTLLWCPYSFMANSFITLLQYTHTHTCAHTHTHAHTYTHTHNVVIESFWINLVLERPERRPKWLVEKSRWKGPGVQCSQLHTYTHTYSIVVRISQGLCLKRLHPYEQRCEVHVLLRLVELVVASAKRFLIKVVHSNTLAGLLIFFRWERKVTTTMSGLPS